MAGEIAGIVDDGATRRVVPVVGKGGLQNIADLKDLRGIDLAIIPADALEYAHEQRLSPGIESSLTYISKLYNQELHLLARPDIKKVSDLSGQNVNVDVPGSSMALTATRLFNLLGLEVKTEKDNQDTALQKLRNGEIAALAFVAAKPAPFFQAIDGTDGLHLLGIPVTPAVADAYVPTRITVTDYPRLVQGKQPIETVAVANVLVAADVRNLAERHRNTANFVDALFTNFDALLAPGHHPKWREVNIAAEFPGWTRHPAAQQWLQRNAPDKAGSSPESLKILFSRFLDERRQAGGGGPVSNAEKDALFRQFRAWQNGQGR
ncbi:MAG: TAXI family TRAP transporter solute-binding subunit [Alphaproteobacteria bacterium]